MKRKGRKGKKERKGIKNKETKNKKKKWLMNWDIKRETEKQRKIYKERKQ